MQLAPKIVGFLKGPESTVGRRRIPADKKQVDLTSGRRIGSQLRRAHNTRCRE
jgi:hypothetical protein